MSDMIKTDYPDLLNSLDSMAGSMYYALRKDVLVAAQTVILAQENDIKKLKEKLHEQEKTRQAGSQEGMGSDPG